MVTKRCPPTFRCTIAGTPPSAIRGEALSFIVGEESLCHDRQLHGPLASRPVAVTAGPSLHGLAGPLAERIGGKGLNMGVILLWEGVGGLWGGMGGTWR